MKYFGTDGIRGRAYKVLTLNIAYKLGQSLRELNLDTVVIGLDTRESSGSLAKAVQKGAINAGINVLFADIVSTPMLSYYSKFKNILGVMVTASHNPYYDNGLKVFKNGNKISEEEELKIEHFIDSNISIDENEKGTFSLIDITDDYLKLYKNFRLKRTALKIIYDSANGANYKIANTYFKHFLSAKQINNTPNGLNINLDCGSTHIEIFKNEMLKDKYDIGFTYDGDGDRVLVLDKDGVLYDGDKLIYLFAKYYKDLGRLKNNGVILTKMANPGIIKALKDFGIHVYLCDIGDKYVYQELNNRDLVIGGEASGHIIVKDLLHTGDGLLNSVLLLEVLEYYDKTLAELCSTIEMYPLKTINIKDINKNVLNRANVINKIAGIRKEIGEDSLLLVRASGTEPLIRVTMSLKNEELLDEKINELVEYIKGANK